jgi:hypothetical protein
MPAALFLLLLAQSFWDRPAATWNEEELTRLFSDSPWGRTADDFANRRSGSKAVFQAVQVYVASSRTMQEAEEQKLVRHTKTKPGLLDEIREAQSEYREYLKENEGKILVIAVPLKPEALADAAEAKKMEQQSYLKSGSRKVRIIGHFPPTPSDPVLRLFFPREIDPAAKDFTVGLYIPGGPFPFRMVYFKPGEMLRGGKPDY